MFQKSIGPVLRGFQFYSICDPEQDRPSDRATSLRSAVRCLNLDIHMSLSAMSVNSISKSG